MAMLSAHTFEAVRTTAARIREVQDFLEILVALENVSSFAEFRESEVTEWEFLNEVVHAADCGILLDVNNIYVSSQNHGFDPLEYVNAVASDRVAQIHVAGLSKFEKYTLDAHYHPVLEAVWAMYARAIERVGVKATLLECDKKIATFDEGHVHSMATSAANVSDVHMLPDLLHGEERKASARCIPNRMPLAQSDLR